MADSPPTIATHNSPRTWLLTSALSPLAVRLIRQLLAHGDYVVACLPPHEIEHPQRSAEFRELINECKSGGRDREGWRDRIRGIRCDGKVGSTKAAVAEAIRHFGRIDILLLCKSEGNAKVYSRPNGNLSRRASGCEAKCVVAVVGTVEELSTSAFTQNLVREQFEAIYFSQVNFIKAALPVLRAQSNGHIISLTSTGGHIGTPGMPMYTAATWALEGYCDSLAYEVAPFNIKVTIVQPNKEIQSLTNRLTFTPQIPAYGQGPAPNIRDMLTNVLNTHPDTALPAAPDPDDETSPKSPESVNLLEPETVMGQVHRRYPILPPGSADKLVQETLHALMAIGGNENPPGRHIVGVEGAWVVKEKLRTVTNELEEFVDASLSVDIFETELEVQAREGTVKKETSSGDASATV
ncbi:hypothetical protein G7046_g8571 [Stylonectria norvegica]|nr:hypothetical protein G7046_g8571 [Stylonectria norvegica]